MKERISLICDDCMQFLPHLNIEEYPITLIITAPPYLLPRIEGGGTVNKKANLQESLSDLKKNQDITVSYDIEEFSKIVNYLQQGNINAYFFCNKNQIPIYLDAYVNKLKCKFDILNGIKPNVAPTFSNKYLADTEYCLFFHKGKGHTHPQSYRAAKTYFFEPINIADKKKYKHPTIKPLSIINTLLLNSSELDDIVLDPFMGSGTTGEAAYYNNRRFIGIEINKTYYDIAKTRIENCYNTPKLF